MKIRFFLAIAVLASPISAQAADRIATITSFDRIRVSGPYRVEIVTGRGSSAKISGAREGIERVVLSVVGRTLTIRPDRTGDRGKFGDDPAGPIVIRLTTGELRAATLSGSGAILIDRARGPRIDLSVEGSGEIAVARIETDRLEIGLLGSGRMKLAGSVKAMNAIVRGAASVDAAGLVANDLKLVQESAGNVAVGARTTAKVTATGAGETVIGGKPSCTVNATGSGGVVCG